MEIWKKAEDLATFPSTMRVMINYIMYDCENTGEGESNSLVTSAKYRVKDYDEKVLNEKIYINNFNIESDITDNITLVSIWNGKYSQDIKRINGRFEVQIQPFMEMTTRERDVSRAISTISINDLKNMLGDGGANDLNHWKIRDIAQKPSGQIALSDCHYIYAGEGRMNVEGFHRASCGCWNSGNWYSNQLTFHCPGSPYCTVFIATNGHGVYTGGCGDAWGINDCIVGWPADPASPTFDTGRYVKIWRDPAGWRTIHSWNMHLVNNESHVQMNIEVHFTDDYFHMRLRVYYNAFFHRWRDGPKIATRAKSNVKVYRGG
ncbi:MAG: hypothetical protein ACRDD8_05385 [Bacteroidales bacterium]